MCAGNACEDAMFRGAAELGARGVRVLTRWVGEATLGPGAEQGGVLGFAVGCLLDNAFEAVAGRQRREITITGGREGDLVRIAVRDTGCGIRREDVRLIFEPFFTTKRGHQGLGLAMCRAAVRAWRGDVFVSSSEASGSEFVIELPVRGRVVGRGFGGSALKVRMLAGSC